MAAAVYCTEADLYAHGVPRGSVPNPGRLVVPGGVSTTDDTFTIDEHGFELNDPIFFRAQGSGSSLPAPLASGTRYYAIPVDDFRFKVASVADGAAVDLTTAGDNIIVLAPLPKAEAIAWASRLIDNMLVAHVVPLVPPIDPIVAMTCAELAAAKLVARGGPLSKSLAATAEDARKRLERWAAGAAVRGETPPPAANLATSLTLPSGDSGGWRRFGGIS